MRVLQRGIGAGVGFGLALALALRDFERVGGCFAASFGAQRFGFALGADGAFLFRIVARNHSLVGRAFNQVADADGEQVFRLHHQHGFLLRERIVAGKHQFFVHNLKRMPILPRQPREKFHIALLVLRDALDFDGLDAA